MQTKPGVSSEGSNTSLGSSKKHHSSTSHAGTLHLLIWFIISNQILSLQYIATRATVIHIPYTLVPSMDINSSAYLKASHALQAISKSAAEDVSNKSSASPLAAVPCCEPCPTSANHHFTPCPSPAKVNISWSFGLIFSNSFIFYSPALPVLQSFVFSLPFYSWFGY